MAMPTAQLVSVFTYIWSTAFLLYQFLAFCSKVRFLVTFYCGWQNIWKKGLSFAESDFYYCGYFLHRQDHDSLVEWIAVIITPHNSDYCLASTVDYILLLERALIFFNGIYSKPFKWLILDLKIHWPKHVLYVQQALSLIKIYMIQNSSAFSINLSTCNKCLSVALLSDVALIDKTCAWYFQNIILLILYKMILIKR